MGTCEACTAHQAFGDWLGSWPWQVFGTSTVHRARVGDDGRPVFPSAMTAENYSRRFASILVRLERRLGRRIVCVWGVEAHQDGYPHGHFLLSVDGGVREGDFRAIAREHWERLGFVRCELPRDRTACARYAAKYLLKTGCDLEVFPEVIPWRESRGGLQHSEALQVRRWERPADGAVARWHSVLQGRGS